MALATRAPLTVIVSRMDEGMSHLLLLSIPLFVFLGILIDMTGMARAMVAFLASLLGHVRGGLSYVLLGAMYLVSGISGAKAADMAAVAPVLFPEMKARGMKPGELVSLLAASGAMAETIPPSVVLIVIGSVASVSIAALFTGGLLPAAGAGAGARRSSPSSARATTISSTRKRATGREIGKAFVIAIPALILPFLIRAAVVEGVATAVEVSTIGIAYTIVAGLFIYRQFDWRRVWPMLVDTASLSGAILFIVGTATAMAWALTQSGFSRELALLMAKMPGGAAGFMALSIVVFVILGSVLEGVPALVLLAPLLFPIARQLGIHEVHYSMVVILAMGIGLFAPPFGVGFFTACAIGNVDPDEAVARVWPYLGALLIGDDRRRGRSLAVDRVPADKRMIIKELNVAERAWLGRVPPTRWERHYGDRVVRCFVERPAQRLCAAGRSRGAQPGRRGASLRRRAAELPRASSRRWSAVPRACRRPASGRAIGWRCCSATASSSRS